MTDTYHGNFQFLVSFQLEIRNENQQIKAELLTVCVDVCLSVVCINVTRIIENRICFHRWQCIRAHLLLFKVKMAIMKEKRETKLNTKSILQMTWTRAPAHTRTQVFVQCAHLWRPFSIVASVVDVSVAVAMIELKESYCVPTLASRHQHIIFLFFALHSVSFAIVFVCITEKYFQNAMHEKWRMAWHSTKWRKDFSLFGIWNNENAYTYRRQQLNNRHKPETKTERVILITSSTFFFAVSKSSFLVFRLICCLTNCWRHWKLTFSLQCR